MCLTSLRQYNGIGARLRERRCVWAFFLNRFMKLGSGPNISESVLAHAAPAATAWSIWYDMKLRIRQGRDETPRLESDTASYVIYKLCLLRRASPRLDVEGHSLLGHVIRGLYF